MDKGDFDRLQRQMGDLPVNVVRNIVVSLVVIGVLLVAAFTSVYQVEAQGTGVVLRFGKLHAISPPGLHWKLPFFIDTVDHVPTKLIKKADFGTGPSGKRYASRQQQGDVTLMITGDLNIAQVPWTVQYRINNAPNFLFNVRNPDETLRDVAESAMRLVVGDYSITDVLTEQRNAIEIEVKENLQSVLDQYEAGIEVTEVNLQNVAPPGTVKDAYDDVTAARIEKEKTINAARRRYNEVIPKARGEARQKVQVAQGYKAKRVNEALGDVAKFSALFKEYQRAPDVTRTRLYLEAVSEVLPDLDQLYILDSTQQAPLQVLDLKQAAAAKVGRERAERRPKLPSDSRANSSRPSSLPSEPGDRRSRAGRSEKRRGR